MFDNIGDVQRTHPVATYEYGDHVDECCFSFLAHNKRAINARFMCSSQSCYFYPTQQPHQYATAENKNVPCPTILFGVDDFSAVGSEEQKTKYRRNICILELTPTASIPSENK